MPKFLEDKLRREYAGKGLRGRALDHAVFGTMNSVGAMRGNQETAKGRRMERKHERDTSAAKRQDGAHPHRMAGRSSDGSYVTEHHRKH